MINDLHELLKNKENYSVTIRLWPLDEVDIIIMDQSEVYEPSKQIFSCNEENLDDALIKTIDFLENL